MSAVPDERAALLHYEQALAPFLKNAERLRPPGAEVIDAHTHLGLDEDGRSLDLTGLLSMLDAAEARRACVFPLHDPERRPSYSLPNDRVLRWAGESGGRLTPFCRLDPAEDPLSEGTRCIEAGARGIKLHPRAQAFDFSGSQMQGIFALAEEAGVPILIHAGRGLPPLAQSLVDLALKHPGATLILAHGAICDQGIITAGLADHPAVLYDTSCFFPIDLIELLARVPAERVVFASDPPYGATSAGLYLALRVAAHAGLEERALRCLIGETMAALIDGDDLPAPTGRRRPGAIALSGRLARVYGYASLAGPALFAGAAEQALAMIDMAIAATRLPVGGEAEVPDHEGEALTVIAPALETALLLLADEEASQTRMRAAMDLIFRSIAMAATAVPDSEAVEALQSASASQLSG
jgi:predicted TIM-barrel fold metal-dependent hydrolase